jgi:hypothetical protein
MRLMIELLRCKCEETSERQETGTKLFYVSLRSDIGIINLGHIHERLTKQRL